MKTSDFDYSLPPALIAQTPIEPRDHSRLLVMDRMTGNLQHDKFFNLSSYLHAGDILILNETRVIPARLKGRKIPGGGKVELLLLRKQSENTWEVLVGGKGVNKGRMIRIEDGPVAEVTHDLAANRRLVKFDEPIEAFLSKAGHVPLPPYIHEPLKDPERYQTIYARTPGSSAAPTAGLHFTSRLFETLLSRGVQIARITLHVGLDTFAPVTEDAPEKHPIHTEWCQVSDSVAMAINQVSKVRGRIIAVGTTTVRCLESAARVGRKGEKVSAYQGPTDLFILPGFRFQVVDGMITNFHLPRSTLIMLVSAFAGRDNILNAYRVAVDNHYRFYSFGDAMLIY